MEYKSRSRLVEHQTDLFYRAEIYGIQITGVGACVPIETTTDYDLAREVDTTREWITTKAEIRAKEIVRFLQAVREAPI